MWEVRPPRGFGSHAPWHFTTRRGPAGPRRGRAPAAAALPERWAQPEGRHQGRAAERSNHGAHAPSPPSSRARAPKVESKEHGKLMAEYGPAGDFDPASQVSTWRLCVHRAEGGELVGTLHESSVPQRAFTLPELELLGRLAGLRLAAAYGDLSLKVGLGHEDAYRLVACFVKDGAPAGV
jgi:hypothetical protein